MSKQDRRFIIGLFTFLALFTTMIGACQISAFKLEEKVQHEQVLNARNEAYLAQSESEVEFVAGTPLVYGDDFEALDVTVKNAKSIDVISSANLFEVSQKITDDDIIVTFAPSAKYTYGSVYIRALDAEGKEAYFIVERATNS